MQAQQETQDYKEVHEDVDVVVHCAEVSIVRNG